MPAPLSPRTDPVAYRCRLRGSAAGESLLNLTPKYGRVDPVRLQPAHFRGVPVRAARNGQRVCALSVKTRRRHAYCYVYCTIFVRTRFKHYVLILILKKREILLPLCSTSVRMYAECVFFFVYSSLEAWPPIRRRVQYLIAGYHTGGGEKNSRIHKTCKYHHLTVHV